MRACRLQAGLENAGRDAGQRDLGSLVRRALAVSAIAVGDVEKDLLYLVEGELEPPHAAAQPKVSERASVGGRFARTHARTHYVVAESLVCKLAGHANGVGFLRRVQ